MLMAQPARCESSVIAGRRSHLFLARGYVLHCFLHPRALVGHGISSPALPIAGRCGILSPLPTICCITNHLYLPVCRPCMELGLIHRLPLFISSGQLPYSSHDRARPSFLELRGQQPTFFPFATVLGMLDCKWCGQSRCNSDIYQRG